jgi:hypothetical protein
MAWASVDDLESRSHGTLAEVCALIEEAGLEEASFGDAYIGRRGADVLSHLHGWHVLFVGWCDAHRAGSQVHFPAEGYTWDTLRALNDSIYAEHRDRGYDEIKAMTIDSRAALFAAVRRFSEAEVLEPEAFPWAGGPLIDLADECSAEHDSWALGRIRAATSTD